MFRPSIAAFAALMAAGLAAQSPKHGVGRTPTEAEIRVLGITVAPDGTGLPEGSGSAVEGRALFAQRCAKCRSKKAAEGENAPKRYEIVCDNCGKHDQVPFQPKVGRTVLCRECHEASRSRARFA